MLQGVDKFRHCYLRYDALLAQQRAEAGPGAGAPAAAPGPGALLQRLLAAFGGGDDGDDDAWQRQAAAAAAAALPPPSSFERAFLQEVQRLRLFVKSSLEQLWLALLESTSQLRGLGEELLQVGAGRGRAWACGAGPRPMLASLVCPSSLPCPPALPPAALLPQAGAASAGQSQALGARLAVLRAAYDANAQVRGCGMGRAAGACMPTDLLPLLH